MTNAIACGRKTGHAGSRAPGIGLLTVLALCTAGCTTDNPYTAPKFSFLPGYTAARGGAPVLLSNAEWWKRLNDPVLSDLVAIALQDSLSLELARERVTEARAALLAVPGAATLSPSAGIRAADQSNGDFQTTGTADLGLSWMLDPYGGRRAQIRAAGARIEVADAEIDAAQLLLLYNITNAYIDLRYRQRLLVLRQQELRTSQRTLNLTRELLAAESTTRLESARAEARVAEIRAQLPDLQAATAARTNEIAVLTGTPPGTLKLDLGTGADQPRPALSPDVGIPTDLLRNRPDIRIAERGYYAALAEVEQARASLYPTLSLTGAISLNLLDGGSPGAGYYFGPAIQFPTLPGNSARAGVELRHSRARQAYVSWESTVLTAILEVENALLDYQAVSASLDHASRAARLYREALTLTREVFRRGEATLSDLIDAEEAVASADGVLAEKAFLRAQSFVALNVRLGAGHAVEKSIADAEDSPL